MPHEDGDGSDLLSCPVCLDTFQNPHLFPRCGHTFCRACMERLAGAPHRISCPTCRSGPLNLQDARPNFALQHILDSAARMTPEAGRNLLRQSLTGAVSERSRSLPALARRATTDFTPSATLQEWNVPFGLAELLEQEAQKIARRIFLLDNSGSTAMADGKYMQPTHPGSGILREVPCTRWQEVAEMAKEHARWNMVLGVPCEFHLLNPVGEADVEGLGYMVTSTETPAEPQLAALGRFLDNNGPKGVTPLASRLTDIRRRIEVERRELMTTGQRVVLVIATDGLPTSAYGGQSNQQDRRDLVQALRALSVLDVHIVLRLCTDQTDVVDFYGDFDKEVELSLEVLDDLTAEARELSKVGNSLLTYTPLLHRVREGGTFFKVLDVIDERALTPGEIYLLAQMLLRRSPDDALLPREPTEFCNEVERRLKANPAGQYFEPLSKKLAPPMDAYYLRSAMGLTGVSAAMKWVEGLMWGNCRPPEWIKLPRLTL